MLATSAVGASFLSAHSLRSIAIEIKGRMAQMVSESSSSMREFGNFGRPIVLGLEATLPLANLLDKCTEGKMDRCGMVRRETQCTIGLSTMRVVARKLQSSSRGWMAASSRYLKY